MLFPEAWSVPVGPIFALFVLTVHCRDGFVAPIPEAERKDMLLAYHAQLNSADAETATKAAKAWTRWECVQLRSPFSTALIFRSPGCGHRNFTSTLLMLRWLRTTTSLCELTPFVFIHVELNKPLFNSAFSRIENHYFVNEGWMRDGQLLEKQAIDKMCDHAHSSTSH